MKISNAPFGCRYWSLEFGIGIGDLQYSCLDESENWHWNDSPIPLGTVWMLALEPGIRNWNSLAPMPPFGCHWNCKSETGANTALHSLHLPAPLANRSPAPRYCDAFDHVALALSSPSPSPSAGRATAPLHPPAHHPALPLLPSVGGPRPFSTSSYS